MQYNSPVTERDFASLLPFLSVDFNHDERPPPFQVDHLPRKAQVYKMFAIQETCGQAMS